MSIVGDAERGAVLRAAARAVGASRSAGVAARRSASMTDSEEHSWEALRWRQLVQLNAVMSEGVSTLAVLTDTHLGDCVQAPGGSRLPRRGTED